MCNFAMVKCVGSEIQYSCLRFHQNETQWTQSFFMMRVLPAGSKSLRCWEHNSYGREGSDTLVTLVKRKDSRGKAPWDMPWDATGCHRHHSSSAFWTCLILFAALKGPLQLQFSFLFLGGLGTKPGAAKPANSITKLILNPHNRISIAR